jgi:serine protease Do
LRNASLIFLTCLATSLCPTLGSGAELPEKFDSFVFKVEAFNSGGTTSLGSAVRIFPAQLITNCHVIRQAQRIELQRANVHWAAQVQNRDIEHDLCLLSANGISGPTAPLGNTQELHLGQPVVAVGYSGGHDLATTAGSVQGLHSYDGARVVETNARFSPGASGGGLFDADGRLVGILTFKSVGGEFHYALPVDWIAHLSSPDHARRPSWSAKAFWERIGDQQPEFMRAAAYEVDGDWKGLLELGKRWVQHEATSPHPWIAVALAYLHLNRIHEAITAFRKAVGLDPRCAATVPQFAGLASEVSRGAACTGNQDCSSGFALASWSAPPSTRQRPPQEPFFYGGM